MPWMTMQAIQGGYEMLEDQDQVKLLDRTVELCIYKEKELKMRRRMFQGIIKKRVNNEN